MSRRLPPRGARARAPLPRRRRGRKRWLGLLGVAAVGAGVAWMARREGAGAPVETLGDGAPPEPAPEAPQPDAGRWVDGPAGRLWVHVAGDAGPAVLLLHSLAGTGAHWTAQLAALGGSCRVAAPDLRGHGRSAAAAGAGYAIPDLAADALAVADALGFDRFVVAGHSLGAAVAVEVAAAHPSRVLGLALIDPGADASGEPAAAEAGIASVAADARAEFTYHYREFLHGARRDTAKRVLADLAATPDATLVGSYAGMMRYPLRQRLAAYRGPRLCLAGPLNDVAGSLPTTLPELATEWLAPTSHWLQLDRREETSHLLGEFVGRVAREPRGWR